MLSRVTLRGFKSFARTTTVELGHGVNVVVGPNGSGKSNLVEAILWALGEQRSASLRADGMQEILFGGDPSTPAAQLAEVTLTLSRVDAPDGAPSELEVSRGLTRAGDADYRVDGEGCRLLDLRERLADWGLSSDGLAIIRQGQVERLCTSRPSDIRAIIEESAGVAVSRRRRRRAELKLARVEDRLARARDLAAEVTSRGRSLTRQARAAERAADLERDVAAGRQAAAAATAWSAAEHHRQAQAARAARAGDRAEAARLLDVARRERDGARAAADSVLAQLRDVEAATAALTLAAERVGGRGELAGERVAAEAERVARAERERQRAESRRAELAEEVARRAVQVGETEAAVAVAEKEAGGTEEALREERQRERALRDAAAAASRALIDAEQALADVARRRTVLVADLARAEKRVAEAGDVDDKEALDRAERRDAVSSQRVARWEERFAEVDRAARDSAAEREAAEVRLRECRSEAGRLDPDAGSALAGAIGEGLQVEAGTERAVAAALGALVEALPVKHVKAAQKAIADGAPAALVPAPDRGPGSGPPGARSLVELIADCAPAARAHVERLLGDAWLVEDLAEVPSGSSGLFVTRDGLALRPETGVVVGASGSWARRAVFERARERERAAEEAAGEASEVADRAAERLVDVQNRRRAAARSAARAAEQLAALRAARAGRVTEAQQALDSRAACERADVEAAEAARTVEASAEEARRESVKASEMLAAARPRLAKAETAWRAAATAAADARAAAAAAAAGRAEAEARLDAAVEASVVREQARTDVEAAENAVAALSTLAAALTRQAETVDRAASGLRERRGAAEVGLTASNREVERTEARHGSAQEAASRADVEAAVAAERASEAGAPPEEDPELDPEAARTRLDALERSLEAVGPVNALAAEELAEIQSRRGDLDEQIADLAEASSSLRGHLEQLDDVVQSGFDRAMATIEERFAEVIGLLFPGGHGRLRSVEEEGEDPGVVIEVVPAGKAARSLSLLSGGERSLVALSFLLALAMTRPAPVYLLDEVEAALDDVNLRRFLAVVRRLSDETQFVLITHQQATVESGDILFGITMEAGGTSKLVSRRLNRSPTAEGNRPRLTAIAGGGV